MKRIIVFTSFLSICILITGCGIKQAKVEIVNKTQTTNNVDKNINASKNGNSSKNQETINTQAAGSSVTMAETNYLKYSGTWVTESNLKEDFKYGVVLSIDVDKNGNIKGVVSDSTENLSHISNVDIKGKIQNNKFTYNFDEDGWEHSGTINLDFQENKIVLTMKYSPSSSKNNFWGIGEGTFTLINNNTKVDRTLNNLKDGGLVVIENQSFPVNIKNYGNVKFISGLKRENSNDNVNFYLTDDKNNVLYKFPEFYGNSKGMFKDISAISFTDVNNDGLKDIIIIADYSISLASPTTIGSIYFQKGKEFINNKALDDKINSSQNNKDIATVLKYAKENLVKK